MPSQEVRKRDTVSKKGRVVKSVGHSRRAKWPKDWKHLLDRGPLVGQVSNGKQFRENTRNGIQTGGDW